MTRTAVRVEDVSKLYRLGTVGARTLQEDCQRLWARLHRRPDPLAKIGTTAHRDAKSILALDRVSFELGEGEVVGLIGRNGAGKSTMLKILSRITAPTGGVAKIRGRVASLLEVGTGFHPELTGRENVFLNGAILGMTRDEIARRFDEIVEFSGLAAFIDTPVKRYSSGMYVRLAFGVAAHLECEILLVDEILAVGDAEFQKRCLGRLQELCSQRRTVVFVSHNLAAVSALCQRGVLFDDGRKRADGPIDDVLAAYADLLADAPAPALRVDDKRLGSGKARIRQVRCTDGRGKDVVNVRAGETLVLVFT
jgi:lipopolysaccharide transport system ATP-binding protein